MYIEILFMLIVAAIFLGLTKSTENVLAIRNEQREDGKEPNVYL